MFLYRKSFKKENLQWIERRVHHVIGSVHKRTQGRYVLAIFEAKREYCQKLLDNYYSRDTYPEKEKVETEYRLMVDILGQRKDNIALLTNMVCRQDELFESAEDMEDVEMFFKAQREAYDDAQRCLTDISREREYFASDADTIKAIGDITAILSMPRPYSRIGELPELIRKINTAYGALCSWNMSTMRKKKWFLPSIFVS